MTYVVIACTTECARILSYLALAVARHVGRARPLR